MKSSGWDPDPISRVSLQEEDAPEICLSRTHTKERPREVTARKRPSQAGRGLSPETSPLDLIWDLQTLELGSNKLLSFKSHCLRYCGNSSRLMQALVSSGTYIPEKKNSPAVTFQNKGGS